MKINDKLLKKVIVPIVITIALVASLGLILSFTAPASVYDELSLTITPKDNQAFAAGSDISFSIEARSSKSDIGGVTFELFAVKDGISQWILVHEKDVQTGFKQYAFTGSLGELANGSYSIKGTAWLEGKESETVMSTATFYVGRSAFGIDIQKYASLELLFPLLAIPILVKWRKRD